MEGITMERDCTRCEGKQTLLASDAKRGFGIYQCDYCELRIGYDLDSTPAEFLIKRGIATRYSTSETSSVRLLVKEIRIEARVNSTTQEAEPVHA
jgi:hypothetical protein